MIFIIVLLSSSMKSVHQTDWAIKYNWWSTAIDAEPIVTPGLHWVGMGNTLILYPNVVQNTRYNLEVRTFDGLSLQIDIEFTYRLQAANLNKLFILAGPGSEDGYPAPGYNTAHEPLLRHVATGVLDNLATMFVAKSFYLNRTSVADTFKLGLTEALAAQLFIDVLTLQLQNSVMPQAYTQAILRTSMLDRNISVAQQERATKVIQMETQKQMAERLAEKTIITAQGEAGSLLAEATAKVDQFKYGIKREAEGYKKSLEYFAGRSGSGAAISDFMAYMDVRAMQDHSSSSKTIKMTNNFR